SLVSLLLALTILNAGPARAQLHLPQRAGEGAHEHRQDARDSQNTLAAAAVLIRARTYRVGTLQTAIATVSARLLRNPAADFVADSLSCQIILPDSGSKVVETRVSSSECRASWRIDTETALSMKDF